VNRHPWTDLLPGGGARVDSGMHLSGARDDPGTLAESDHHMSHVEQRHERRVFLLASVQLTLAHPYTARRAGKNERERQP